MVVLQLNPNIFRKQLVTQPLTGNSELSKLHARNLVLNVLDLQLDWISGPVVVRLRLGYLLKEQDLEVWVVTREEAYLDSYKLEIYVNIVIGIFRNNFNYNIIQKDDLLSCPKVLTNMSKLGGLLGLGS